MADGGHPAEVYLLGAKDGCLSSYSWTLLVIFYLQVRLASDLAALRISTSLLELVFLLASRHLLPAIIAGFRAGCSVRFFFPVRFEAGRRCERIWSPPSPARDCLHFGGRVRGAEPAGGRGAALLERVQRPRWLLRWAHPLSRVAAARTSFMVCGLKLRSTVATVFFFRGVVQQGFEQNACCRHGLL